MHRGRHHCCYCCHGHHRRRRWPPAPFGPSAGTHSPPTARPRFHARGRYSTHTRTGRCTGSSSGPAATLLLGASKECQRNWNLISRIKSHASSLKSHASSLMLQVSCFKSHASSLMLQVSSLMLQVSSLMLQVSSLMLQVSSLMTLQVSSKF